MYELINWYALKVFYNRVQQFKETWVDPAGVQSFVPMHVVEQYARGELSYAEKQLVPSLLFVRCTEGWLEALKDAHPNDFLFYPDARGRKPGAIRDEEMRSFILVTSANGNPGDRHFMADLPQYHTGDRVRVTDGIYKDAEGYVKRIKKDRKLIVSVTGVAVVAVSNIHPSFLEKI